MKTWDDQKVKKWNGKKTEKKIKIKAALELFSKNEKKTETDGLNRFEIPSPSLNPPKKITKNMENHFVCVIINARGKGEREKKKTFSNDINREKKFNFFFFF